MRALFTQFSGLVGLLTFLNQLMSNAPLEKTIYLGLCAGLTVYLVLLLGDVAIHRILESVANLPQPASAGNAAVAETSAPANEAGRPAAPAKAPDAPPVARTETSQNKDAQAV